TQTDIISRQAYRCAPYAEFPGPVRPGRPNYKLGGRAASHEMSDYIGFGIFLGWGLWWLVFPNSAIRFYTRFHSGKVRLPRPLGVRLAGALWIVLVIMLAVFAKK